MNLPDEIVESMKSQGFVTNFIAIYETSNGKARTMQVSTSEGMTPWLAEGMVNFGQRVLWQMGGKALEEDDN